MIQGKCNVIKKNDLPSLDLPVIMDHIFFCECSFDPTQGSLKQVQFSKALYVLITDLRLIYIVFFNGFSLPTVAF